MTTVKIIGVETGHSPDERRAVGMTIAAALRSAGVQFRHVATLDPWTGGQGTREMWESVETGEEVW